MSYQLALSLHLFALIAASAASGMMHISASRRAAAPTLRQAMEWGRIMGGTARIFPIATLVLVATGIYMVAGRWSWSTGWIDAGLAGAGLLFVSGAVLGKRAAAQARAGVERLQRAGRDVPNDAPPDRLSAALKDANTGLALGIVLAMTIKPGLAGSVVMLAVGAAAGAYLGLSHSRPASQVDRISQAA